jgi:tetratricopeptide (TPR) repeat protein
LGFLYTQKQQYDQALAESERAIALAPNNAESYFGQAHVLLWAGRPEEVTKSVEQAMRLNPRYNNPFLSAHLGMAYNMMGRATEAVVTLKEVVSRLPDNLVFYRALADSYVHQWDSQQSQDPQTLAQALAVAQRAVTLNDAVPMSHMILGIVYLWQQRYDQALVEGERGVALNPPMSDPYAILAETLSRVGQSEEALQMVEQALRRKPPIPDQHLNSVGTAYYFAGKPEEAISPLKQYLARYPGQLGAHLTLTAVYSELGKDAEAQAEAAAVLRLNPQFSLEVHKQRVPIKDSAVLERHIAALRKAGLQ